MIQAPRLDSWNTVLPGRGSGTAFSLGDHTVTLEMGEVSMQHLIRQSVVRQYFGIKSRKQSQYKPTSLPTTPCTRP